MALQKFFKEYPTRSPSDFVGRDAELNQFQRILNQLPDGSGCCILNISGQAGVGKTELLRQYRKQAEAAGIIAFTTEMEPDVPSVMGKIADQLKQQKHPLGKFGDRYRTYLQCLQRLEADPEKPQGLTKAIGQAATKGAVSAARQIPVVGVAVSMLDETTLAAQGGEWLAFVAKKLTDKDDVRLVKSPVEELTPLFLRDLREISNRHPIILFFDAYERTSAYLDLWLREILAGEAHGPPPGRLLLVIAGQQELSRTEWDVFHSGVVRQPLQPFSDREAREFLKRKGITEASLVTEILEQSGRLPLHLNTLAVQAPTSPTAVVDRADDMVDRYLRWIEDPQKRKLVLDAALARSINLDVIAILTASEQADALFDWLVKQPFVNKKAKTWCYESLMQKLMVRYKRQRSVMEWVALHGKLAQLYQQLCEVQGLDAVNSQHNLTWQTYQLEQLYHQLCQAPQKYLQTALLEFLAAFKRQPMTAHRWAETIRQAGEETEFDELTHWGEQMVRGVAAYNQANPTDAIALFTTLLKQGNLDPEWQAKVLHWRGNLYRQTQQYTDALSDLQEAVRLMPQVAEYYRDRGLVYLLNGQFASAFSDLDRAIELNPQDARAIAYRGSVYQVQGNSPMALQEFTQALQLHPNFRPVLVSRAATYRDLGEYKAALADLDEALLLLPEDLTAIAERGKVLVAMGQPEAALSNLNQVIKQNPDDVSLLINRGMAYQQLNCTPQALADFNRALELEPKNLDALANRGELFRCLGQYEAAIVDLSRVIEQNPEDAWAIGTRGSAYFHAGFLQKALRDLDRAIARSPEKGWWYYCRTLVHRRLHRMDAARSDLKTAVQLEAKALHSQPQDWGGTLNLALYYLVGNQPKYAEALYQQALRHASSGQLQTALNDLNQFQITFPTHPHIQPIKDLLKLKLQNLHQHGGTLQVHPIQSLC